MALTLRFIGFIVFLFAFVGWAPHARASGSTFELTDAPRASLQNRIRLELTDSRAPLHELVQVVPEGAESRVKGASTNVGFTDKTVLGTFRLSNDSDTPERRWLELGTPTTDYVAMKVGDEAVQVAGLLVPRVRHTVVARLPTFQISVPARETVDVVFALRGESRLNVLASLYTDAGLIAESSFQGLSRGLLLGAVCLLAFYNLVLFVFIRRRTHLLYFLSVMGWVFSVAALDGSLRSMLPPSVDLPPRASLVLPLIVGQTGINQFLRRFLNVRVTSPKVDKILAFWVWLFPIFGLPMLLLTWVGPPGVWRVYGTVMPMLGTANMLMLLYVVAKRGYSGHIPARIALFGFVVFSGLTTITALGSQGLFPNSGVGLLVHIGIACDALALSVGLAYAARLTQNRTVALKAAADRFVPFEFLQKLARDDITQVTHGDQVQTDMTVFFSDVRSFTSVVEGLSPQETIQFVNEHLRVMEGPIQKHGGFIDKFIGDAVMALFDSAEAAVLASIECQRALDEDNRQRIERGLAPVEVGIGLHHGEVMLGTVGGKERLSCTVLGDTVNLASRVEGMTKFYGARAIVTQAVVDRLPPNGSWLRKLDVVAVKGKKEPVAIYEVLDAQSETERKLRSKTLPLMKKAIELYIEGKPAESLETIRQVRGEDPNDTAAALFESRCQAMIESGIPESWDGVTRMTTK